MFSPAKTEAGPLLVTLTSALGLIVVVKLALLLPRLLSLVWLETEAVSGLAVLLLPFGSAVLLVTLAVLVIVPGCVGRTTTVTTVWLPAAGVAGMSPRLQTTVLPLCVQVGVPGVTEMKVALAGRLS